MLAANSLFWKMSLSDPTKISSVKSNFLREKFSFHITVRRDTSNLNWKISNYIICSMSGRLTSTSISIYCREVYIPFFQLSITDSIYPTRKEK